MDYFGYNRRRGDSVTRERLDAPLPPINRRPPNVGSYESLRAPSSIRIRRLPSNNAVPQTPRPESQLETATTPAAQDSAISGRRRSSSEPQHYGSNLAPPQMDLARQRTLEMPTITEGRQTVSRANPTQAPSESSQEYHEAREEPRPLPTPSFNIEDGVTPGEPASRVVSGASAMHSAGDAARRNRGLRRYRSGTSSVVRNEQPAADEYNSDMVDLLDLVDPEVRTIGTLTNVQNSLFVPDLGSWLNRRPTYNLTRGNTASSTNVPPPNRTRAGTAASRPADLPTIPQATQEQSETEDIEMQPRATRTLSISSNLSDSRFAVLPHGINLEGWTEEDKAELDDHVRHLLHSRREGFKRSMRGFRQYISKPLGLFVTVYATLITLFGAAWVFFLIGWIYVGHRQQYIINIVDNLLVAFFALIGDGLAPFRAVDTYHMCFIARYYHMTWRLRKERELPELVDHNDLPDRRVSNADIEDMVDKEETAEFSVLKPIQQKRLQYHQAKFAKAHTFYRPHETPTHHAFPLRLLVAVVVLLDCHSCFQVALGSTTWSWNYHSRPEALTATILSCSISCNIIAGVLISIGDRRTRKKDVMERLFRQELTQEALGRMRKEHPDSELRADIEDQLVKSEDAGPSVDEPEQAQRVKEMESTA